MGQCLALLNTTAFSTDRGEYLKISPIGRIPARRSRYRDVRGRRDQMRFQAMGKPADFAGR
jgi:hypothetical protein